MPKKPSYIFVSGGVLSGVGKGIVTASVALLLKSRGMKVTVVKCENYLNIDSGLINPIEHGDPFLCEDGAETDMDLGTYEKFLDQNLSIKNFITLGQIYQSVITRERNFGYNGEDVEAIPHVTDEIIARIKSAGEADTADIVIVELGGTAGEYQNVLYYEASRIMKFAQQETVIHIHVSYLPTPSHLGEPKTKPTQLSVKTLNSMGIQPDFIVARADRRMDERRRSRFALFCSVKSEHIIDAPDVQSVYEIPVIFADQQFDTKILNLLNLPAKPLRMSAWSKLVEMINKLPKAGDVTIAIVGKYFATGDYNLRDSYAALYDALDHAATFHHVKLTIVGINSEKTTGVELENELAKVDGIIVPIGWGERGVEGKIATIKYARERKIPYLGLCYGMQLAVVEYARHVLGWKEAHTTEVNPKTPYPVVFMIPEQRRITANRAYGGTMRLGRWEAIIKPDSVVDHCYQTHHQYENEDDHVVSERHRHRWEFNDDYAFDLENAGLVISGRSVKEHLVEYIELPSHIHPFFVGTQGHPEYKSRPLRPHALFLEFIRAAFKQHAGTSSD